MPRRLAAGAELVPPTIRALHREGLSGQLTEALQAIRIDVAVMNNARVIQAAGIRAE